MTRGQVIVIDSPEASLLLRAVLERWAPGLYQNHKISAVSTPACLLDTYKFNCLDKVPKDSRTCSVNQYLAHNGTDSAGSLGFLAAALGYHDG